MHTTHNAAASGNISLSIAGTDLPTSKALFMRHCLKKATSFKGSSTSGQGPLVAATLGRMPQRSDVTSPDSGIATFLPHYHHFLQNKTALPWTCFLIVFCIYIYFFLIVLQRLGNLCRIYVCVVQVHVPVTAARFVL